MEYVRSRHEDTPECWNINIFSLTFIFAYNFVNMIKLSANIPGVVCKYDTNCLQKIASSWNSRLQHSGVSASLVRSIFYLSIKGFNIRYLMRKIYLLQLCGQSVQNRRPKFLFRPQRHLSEK